MAADKKTSKPKEAKVILYRSAEDGQFVTGAVAKRHPATTERVRPIKRTTSKGK